jgi:hypothetical protein
MSRKLVIHFFIFLLVFCDVFAHDAHDEQPKTLKNLTVDEQVVELDKQLIINKYAHSAQYEKLLADLENIPDKKLNTTSRQLKACALAEGFLAVGKSSQAILLITTSILPRIQSLTYREEGLYLWFITRSGNNKELALSIAKKRLNKARLTRDISKSYEAYKALSFIYTIHANSDSSIYFASMATNEAKRLSNKTVLLESLRFQGKIYHFFENYVESINKKLQMIQLASTCKNDYFKAFGYFEIARISIELQNYSQASQYIERAKTYFKIINDERGELVSSIFEIQNNYLQGKPVDVPGLLALRIKVEQLEDELSKSLIKMVYSVQLSMQGDYTNSNKELFEALNLLKGREDEKLNYFIHKRLAINFLELNDLNSAEYHLFKALPPFNSSNLLLAETYTLLAKLEEKKGNLRKAFTYQNTYIEISRLNEKRQFSRTVEQLTEGNLREEREKLIEEQQANILKEQKEKERISFQKDRQVIFGISIFILVGMLILIAIIRLRAARSKQKQREAEMSQTLLRSQMNPHFVFNAMSVIQSYIYANDPEKSSRFLVNFSRLMRLILENSPKEMIPLELEYEILDKYLNTQKMRFEDRFLYELNFDEELLFSKAMIPPMIAQPFVENSIEHGQLHTINGGKISVSIKRNENLLEVLIEDNGVGRKQAAKTKKIKNHKSMAIEITRERIEILNRKYMVKGLVEIQDLASNGQGTKVRILLPLKFELS